MGHWFPHTGGDVIENMFLGLGFFQGLIVIYWSIHNLNVMLCQERQCRYVICCHSFIHSCLQFALKCYNLSLPDSLDEQQWWLWHPGVMNHDLSPQQELGGKSALNCAFKGTSAVSWASCGQEVEQDLISLLLEKDPGRGSLCQIHCSISVTI